MEKTHKIQGRPVTHRAWCITQCPCFEAERTVYWFLSGKKEWDLYGAIIYDTKIKSK